MEKLLEELGRIADCWDGNVRNAPLMHRHDAAGRIRRLIEKYAKDEDE